MPRARSRSTLIEEAAGSSNASDRAEGVGERASKRGTVGPDRRVREDARGFCRHVGGRRIQCLPSHVCTRRGPRASQTLQFGGGSAQRSRFGIDGERVPCQHRRASGASVSAVTEKRTEAGHDVKKLSGTAFLEGRGSRSCPARGVFQVARETARRIEV